MAIINGNFTDADGNLVNIADLLRGVISSPENKDHMSPISGWFYDGEGNRVNIIDIIRSADLTDVKGIIVNSGTPITPNKDGYLDVTIDGSGEVIALTPAQIEALIALLEEEV